MNWSWLSKLIGKKENPPPQPVPQTVVVSVPVTQPDGVTVKDGPAPIPSIPGYPKVIHDFDGGVFEAHNPAEEAQHAVDVARTQAQIAANAGPTLPPYTISSVIPVPSTNDQYVVWCRKQNKNWDLIGAVNFFNSQPNEHDKWMFGTMRGSEALTNWISLKFAPYSVSPYINLYEDKQKTVGNPRNPFFPVGV